MARLGVVAALGAAAVLAGCGSVRTALPASVSPAPPLEGAPAEPAKGPSTTASAYKSPGEKHQLPGGTLAASYPRVGVRPPKGSAPPLAPGQSWAVLNVRFCAAAESPIADSLVDPTRFQVEVPGQGLVGPARDAPALAPTPLVRTAVPQGTCLEGSIAYLIGGEGHIESISYDTGNGLLRWAT